jgi:hypothetical protein
MTGAPFAERAAGLIGAGMTAEVAEQLAPAVDEGMTRGREVTPVSRTHRRQLRRLVEESTNPGADPQVKTTVDCARPGWLTAGPTQNFWDACRAWLQRTNAQRRGRR